MGHRIVFEKIADMRKGKLIKTEGAICNVPVAIRHIKQSDT